MRHERFIEQFEKGGRDEKENRDVPCRGDGGDVRLRRPARYDDLLEVTADSDLSLYWWHWWH